MREVLLAYEAKVGERDLLGYWVAVLQQAIIAPHSKRKERPPEFPASVSTEHKER